MTEFLKISSKDNPLIKLVCALHSSSKERKKQGIFVLEGLRISFDALENGIEFDKLIVSESAYEKYQNEIKQLSLNSNNRYLLKNDLFKKISDTDSPQGIITLAKIPEKKTSLNPEGRYIALENLQDPSNLGAVSRTAEALGVCGIILSGGCDPYSSKSLRASMGTLLRMPLYIAEDLMEFICENKLTSYACVVDKNAKRITDVCFPNGSVIIIGNEANGISESTKKREFRQGNKIKRQSLCLY